MPKEIRPFHEVLGRLRQGKTYSELGEALQELVTAVRDTQKPGKLIFSLTLTPGTAGSATEYISVADKVTLKLPDPNRGDTVFFPTKENALSMQHQSQDDLPLGTVDRATGEVILRSAGDEK